jgi:hypothetical protein
MSQQPVKIKKVKAFPIAGQLKTSAAAFPIQVVKLTQLGFLAEITASMLQPGEKFESIFELPVLHRPINEQVVLIKLYNQWGGNLAAMSPAATGSTAPAPPANSETTNSGVSSSPAVLRLIEVHFVALSESGRGNIVNFLNTLRKSAP